jgi:hypothetical protein
MNIPELPIQLLAVTESSNSAGVGGAYASSNPGLSVAALESMLINEGNNLADRLNAHFMTSTSAIQQKCRHHYDVES